MKNVIRIGLTGVALSAAIFTACDNVEVRTKEKQQAQQVLRDSFDKVFTETLRDINTNLQVINEKEGVIMLGPGSPLESNISEKEKVLRNIHLINTLIDDSREKMAKLDEQVKEYASKEELDGKKLKEYKSKTAKLEKLMATTEQRLKEYEEELASLKKELSDRDYQVADLNQKLGASETRSQMLQEYSDMYEKIAFTAYYTCGNYKQLRNEGVVKKEGPIQRLTHDGELADGLSKNSFTPIDIRKTTSIPVNAKKVALITQHPSSAYELKKEGNKIASIEIKNPDEFWKTSKYLVIQTY